MSSETVLNGRYRLVAQQGSGGMAVIYNAIDQALGRTVAVKILRPSLTSDPAFLARFRNEARSVANLTHPNIVTVHDVGSDGPTHYIVMEFIEGQDLKKIIRTDGALRLDRALNLAIQICAGIGFAHRAGLVHADVKPQNILVTKDDTVKVTDFGIAQALSDTNPGEKQSVVWGSPHYFAPEQARGEKPTPASDVYSIGIVVFEMLTGRLPYTGTNQQELALAHIRDRVPTAREFNPNVPDELSRIVYKVMSKEPANRYRMADQLGNILAAYKDKERHGSVGSSSVSLPPPPPASSAPLTGSRPPMSPSQSMSPSQPPGSQGQFVPVYPPAPPPSKPVAPNPVNEPFSTERIGLAPQAPNTMPPARPAASNPAINTPFASGQTGNTSGFYAPPQYQVEHDQAPAGLDAVTIVLAILAFFAVACLIPLYIAVFQARFGG